MLRARIAQFPEVVSLFSFLVHAFILKVCQRSTELISYPLVVILKSKCFVLCCVVLFCFGIRAHSITLAGLELTLQIRKAGLRLTKICQDNFCLLSAGSNDMYHYSWPNHVLRYFLGVREMVQRLRALPENLCSVDSTYMKAHNMLTSCAFSSRVPDVLF